MARMNYGQLKGAAYPKMTGVAAPKLSSANATKAQVSLSNNASAYLEKTTPAMITRITNNVIAILDSDDTKKLFNVHLSKDKSVADLLGSTKQELLNANKMVKNGDRSGIVNRLTQAIETLKAAGADVKPLTASNLGKGVSVKDVVRTKAKPIKEVVVSAKELAWRATAGTVANEIYDFLTPAERLEFEESIYYIELNEWDTLHSEAYDSYIMENGETFQATRIKDFCEMKGIKVPSSILNKIEKISTVRKDRNERKKLFDVNEPNFGLTFTNDPGANRF